MRNHTRCTCSVFSLLNMTSADEEGHLPQEDGQLSEEEGQILQGEDTDSEFEGFTADSLL